MKKLIFTVILTIFFSNFILAQNDNERINLEKFFTSYSAIIRNYVDETDNKKIIEDAIKGMLEKLDPHSTYSNAEETREMNERLDANFDGIGIQFNMLTDTLYVIQVLPGGPSEKVGLLAGDRIIMVDDSLIAGVKMVNSDVQKLIRGKKGTEVRIKVKRDSKPNLLEFKIIRDKIPVNSIDAVYMADSETGYILLSRFASSSLEEFEKAVADLKKKGMKNLILDLQNNSGGYLQVSYALADQFLDVGKLIVYTEGNMMRRSDAISTERGIFIDGKLIILVNEGSASASEIVAGAVQDWDRGVIVGRRTFGKGLVQRAISLPDSSMIRLTTGRYYTPSGRYIQKPYEEGNVSEYNNEIRMRFRAGELTNADSIHFPDSLKYNTLTSNRTVYGGGGITPDIFVPLDTTRYTDYHARLRRNNIIYRTAMNYVDKKRNELTNLYPNINNFKEKFTITEEMWQELLSLAEEENIEFNEEQFVTAHDPISLELKAYIARDFFTTSEYVGILNEKYNNVYLKALQIINDDELYNRILTGGLIDDN
jgi:carboxyl-terminal processing protease